MALWATKKRLIYGGSFFSVVFLVVGLIFWQLIYQAPTCTDGVKNGDEQGVDCGGNCKNLCTADTLSPVTLWAKTFHVSSSVYTAVAYIQNPNINSKNLKAEYKFTIYDEFNNVLLEKIGETSVPKNKKFAVFETGLVVKSKEPKRTEFEFTNFLPWQKDLSLDPVVSLEYSTLSGVTSSPRIIGKITNTSSVTIPTVELDVFVLDAKENVVAASRSFVDNLLKNSTQDFVFTWPKPFNLGVEVCATPLDVAVVLDRSGSMRSESKDPPEPFSTVVATAKEFVRSLSDIDQVSVMTFGNDSRIENRLSLDRNSSVSVIGNLALSSTTQEQTNIYSGLLDAYNELRSDGSRNNAKKAIIMLTDGLPTEPKDPKIQDYPAISAQAMAEDIKASGISLYTIGLGKNVSEGFLRSISTDDGHYFLAPTKERLSGIYGEIGSGLCPKKPNVITVIYRFF
ncbi:MAG: vWA domain-containing protein [Minisyncoccia bacterium]